MTGEIVGAALPLTLGYIFGVSWEAVGALLTMISLLIGALLVVIYLASLFIRMLQRMQATRQSSKKVAQTKPVEFQLEAEYSKQEDGFEPQV